MTALVNWGCEVKGVFYLREETQKGVSFFLIMASWKGVLPSRAPGLDSICSKAAAMQVTVAGPRIVTYVLVRSELKSDWKQR